MCGKWNVRQATSQQMFKVTFCTDTCFPVFFATDQLHRPPCCAKIQPMSQQDASTTRLHSGLVLDMHEENEKDVKTTSSFTTGDVGKCTSY